MIAVTLDTNCIVDLETQNDRAPLIRELVSRHQKGDIVLRIPAISASERQLGGGYIQNFGDFQERVKALGLGDLELLKPICYLDVAFLDWCIFPDEHDRKLELRIHNTLFPEIEFEYKDRCTKLGADPQAIPLDKRWRNAKCDVLGLWSHIHYCGNVFVTSDENFHKATKKSVLVALGTGELCRPAEATVYLDRAV